MLDIHNFEQLATWWRCGAKSFDLPFDHWSIKIGIKKHLLLEASSYSSQNIIRESKSDFLESTKITHVPHLVVVLWPKSTVHHFNPYEVRF